MAQIKLTPEELRQSAQRYAQGSQEIDQILNTLTHEQQVIDANWDGSAFDSFEAQFNELSPKIKQFAQLLEDINAQLIRLLTRAMIFQTTMPLILFLELWKIWRS